MKPREFFFPPWGKNKWFQVSRAKSN